MSRSVNEVLFGRMTRLTHTYRYSAQPVTRRENVAEHSFWTAMIGVTISYAMFGSDGESVAEKVALKALLHDIEECLTGDLVREMKYASDEVREAIRTVEMQFVKNILDPMGPVGDDIYKKWLKSKDESIEGQIVKLADMLCVVGYCTQEMLMGNRELEYIKNECIRLIRRTVDDPRLVDISESVIIKCEDIWRTNAR